MKLLTKISSFILALTATCVNAEKMTQTSAYDFSFETLVGHKPMPLSQFKGKVMLIVNTASKCGFTPQYAGLEKLYKQFKIKGLVIIGVPSDDFGHQEPGKNEEIVNFCQVNFGVTFPMTSKQNVTCEQANPFYRWAKQELRFGSGPKWNFHKYLIDRNGKLVEYFYSTTTPDSPRLVSAIEKALNAS
jgi:glutathione peroxidase